MKDPIVDILSKLIRFQDDGTKPKDEGIVQPIRDETSKFIESNNSIKS